MTSKYIKCDHPGCQAVVDRRPAPDTTHDGTFHWSQSNELRAYATSLGWLCDGGAEVWTGYPRNAFDYCPDHKPTHMTDDMIRAKIAKARSIAAPYGSMHPLWDVISDAECLLKGQRTIVDRQGIEESLGRLP
jgi:hypothetical protein